jgi:nitrilase
MNSGADVAANLKLADQLLADAAADAVQLAVLPENFALMGLKSRDKALHAEERGRGPIQQFLADASRRYGMWIVGGSMPLRSPEPERVYGACPVYDAGGQQQACYLKMHLFDVKLPDLEESYQESWSMYPGDDLACVTTPLGNIGLTICYDVRFPEMFRRLVEKGATAFTVPAAFTQVTGAAHWHVLLRARAVENLAYVIAAGQYGDHPDKRSTFGHSIIIDPWGRVLAEQPAGNCHVAADVDPQLPAKIRAEFPALANRRFMAGC